MKFSWRAGTMARVFRFRIRIIMLALLSAGTLQAGEWQECSRSSKLTIYIRHRSDSTIEEVRGVGEINAPILFLKGILADVAKYSEFMPYTTESRLLSRDDQLCYMLLTPPLVGPRDYTIRVHQESLKGSDGNTVYFSHWEQANSEGPSQRPGVTRVMINNGSWLLEPIGNQTKATYTLYTDGGGVPPLLINFANKQSIARLFDALRARIGDEK